MKLAIGVFFAIGLGASADTISFKTAKELADANEAALSSQDAMILAREQGTVVQSALSKCSMESENLASFVIVAEVDSSGKVLATWRDGTSLVALCFQGIVSKSILTPPVAGPFFTSFQMDFSTSSKPSH